MKRIKLVFVLGMVLASLASVAAAEVGSVGVVLGEPTGISVGLNTSKGQKVNLAAAWSFAGNGSFYLHGDYVFNITNFKIDKQPVDVYLGLGAKVMFADPFVLGARIPVGLYTSFAKAPIDLFLEIAPGLRLIPSTTPDLGGGLGIRYRF